MALVITGILRKSLVESSCDRWLKVMNNDEAIAKEYSIRDGGESRFGIEISNVPFFYRNYECPEFFFFTKSDLLQYLYYVKEEYYHPSQNYWNKNFLKRHYSILYREIKNWKDEVFKLKMYARYDYGSKYDSDNCSRAYLEFLSNNEDDIYAKFKRPIIATKNANQQRGNNPNVGIPQLNEIEFVKIEDSETNKFFIYMKPNFTGKISPERLGILLKEEIEQVDNLYVAHIINLFGIKYAKYFKEDDIDEIVKSLGINECRTRRGYASIANILSTSLKSYELIKSQSTFPDPFSSVDKDDLKEITGIQTEVVGTKNKLGTIAFKSLQIIFYGAPGTGKSHEVKKMTGELDGSGNDVKRENVFRTTFHPDTDYSTFVGCYKPVMTEKEHIIEDDKKEVVEEISYEFVPQTFTDAYIYALKHKDTPTYLVIEEINRGNCAQIFGDLFQLLDRNASGCSEYKIKPDKDLARYLAKELYNNSVDADSIKLSLPSNLNILATMNTSDQSLFPMDSAFKRRWNWEYVAIRYDEPKSSAFEIDIYGKKYLWVDFIRKVNEKIFDLTQSEDKEMGNFFIKDSIDDKMFKSKVMFYLWNEVLRDEVGNGKYFFYYKDGDEKKQFTFKNLYGDDNIAILQGFMDYLEVEEIVNE